MRFLLPLLFFSCCFCTGARAQHPTPSNVREQAYQQRLLLRQQSPAAGLPFENIGPSIMSGRVADLAVDPSDPTHFYVAYASGGLWETRDNGITFTPLFDDLPVMTIGAIAVHWYSKTIYVGTGEVNSSRSSYAGNGVYRSTDGGKSWTNVGLEDTHHIGRLIVDQKDASTVWVAALGHLYGPNKQRGVFKTGNGGGTWTQTLYVNDSTGVVDLIQDPRNPQHLYAASWERERKAWDFKESGSGSGIWESTDGGANWARITGPKSGFPVGEGAGRIGLTMSYEDGGDAILYASIDNYFRRAPEPRDGDDETLQKETLRGMPKADFLRLQSYLLDDFLRGNGFPEDVTADSVRARVERDELTPLQLVEYLEDANSLLFDTPVKGLEVYRTKTNGETWTKTHEGYLDGVYNSYGYYFGQIRSLPNDPSTLYCLGVPIIKSTDGGATWTGINGDNVHADHHSLWINPDRPDHLINGNDGGINISYNGGKNWQKANTAPLGQFYAVAVDDHPDGYRVYGGLQDNGTWRGPANYEASPGWRQRGEYPYKMLFGGDGMQVEIDPRDHTTTYVGFQYGNYYRIDTEADTSTYLTPKHQLGERPLRWNWQSPILISPHDPDVFYLGSNKFHKSTNRGDDFQLSSEDLTHGGRPGDVSYGTLTTISESPLERNLIYVGSDDGMIHRSTDGGQTWARLDETLPQNLWVSRVAAGKHDANVVYASLNGYRYDDFKTYLYVSRDRGNSWTPLNANLPTETVNVIYEDATTPNLLFVGTDHGLYYSANAGRRWFALHNGLPSVAVHDVVIQPSTQDLIVGTHGRSLYKANVAVLQAAATEFPELSLTGPEQVYYSGRYGTLDFDRQVRRPTLRMTVYNPSSPGTAELKIRRAGSTAAIYSKTVELTTGVNLLEYDQTFGGSHASTIEASLNADRAGKKPLRVRAAEDGNYYLRSGEYTAELTSNGRTATFTFRVK